MPPTSLRAVARPPRQTTAPVDGEAATAGLSTHILPTSATLVGACITAISVVKSTHAPGFTTAIDKLLALDSILFLASGILSFVAMRVPKSGPRLEGIAEIFFLVGLGVVTVAATVLAFEIG